MSRQRVQMLPAGATEGLMTVVVVVVGVTVVCIVRVLPAAPVVAAPVVAAAARIVIDPRAIRRSIIV